MFINHILISIILIYITYFKNNVLINYLIIILILLNNLVIKKINNLYIYIQILFNFNYLFLKHQTFLFVILFFK